MDDTSVVGLWCAASLTDVYVHIVEVHRTFIIVHKIAQSPSKV